MSMKSNVSEHQKSLRADRGILITFEGIDGSGKSTQVKLLEDALAEAGYSVLRTAEPSDGPAGRKIRNLSERPSPESELELFTEDRRFHVSQIIGPALLEGKVVLCDRYLHSSIAYQGARGIDPKRILSMNAGFIIRPKRVFYLRIPVEEALRRIETGRTEGPSIFEFRENLTRVARIYDDMSDSNIRVIDGSRRPEIVHQEIITDALKLIGSG
jgi:dTMP kinase